MKAGIINMPSDSRRKADIIRKLQQHPYIDYTFIEAVDGRRLTDSELDILFDRDKFLRTFRRPVKPGEIGCMLSHRRIWEECAASGKPMLAIEDDAVFLRKFQSELAWIESFLNSDRPKMVYMGDIFLYTGRKKVSHYNFSIVRPVQTEVTTCYAINAAAAQTLLNEKPYYPADAWDIYKKRVQVIAILPLIASQEGLQVYGSSINSSTDAKNKFTPTQRLHFKLRHIFKTLLMWLHILKSSRP